KNGDPAPITTHQVLQGETSKCDLFAHRSAEKKKRCEQPPADRNIRVRRALEVRESQRNRRQHRERCGNNTQANTRDEVAERAIYPRQSNIPRRRASKIAI